MFYYIAHLLLRPSCCSSSALQDWWDDKLPENGLMSCLSVIPKVLLAGAITLMDEAYYKLAVWLNDRGDYRDSNIDRYRQPSDCD